MKRASQLGFFLAALFLCFFGWGITDAGQRVLRGNIPPVVDHWKLDDIYMGAGLAPWAYGLLPCVVLASLASMLLLAYKRKRL